MERASTGSQLCVCLLRDPWQRQVRVSTEEEGHVMCPAHSHLTAWKGSGPRTTLALSFTAWVGEVGTEARCWASYSTHTPPKGFLCTSSHLLGLPIFPSTGELCGTKHIQLIAGIRLLFLRYCHPTTAPSGAGLPGNPPVWFTPVGKTPSPSEAHLNKQVFSADMPHLNMNTRLGSSRFFVGTLRAL